MARILVVDDNPEILLVVEASLVAAGFEVVTTAAPERALEILQARPFDGAVLDVMMPRMSGYELLAQLRKLPGGDRLPVLFLSALTDAEARIQGLRLGADDYLGKPFASDELVLRVERLVRNHHAAAHGLEGSFKTFPLTSLVQSLGEDRQSGELELRGPGLIGGMTFREGGLIAARLGSLSGKEAALALVDAEHGHFRFAPASGTLVSGTGATAAVAVLDWQSVLLEAAWTEDELERRRSFLPEVDRPLRPVESSPPEVPEELRGLPVAEMHRQLKSGEASSLEGLLAASAKAPKRIQLALAWMIEQGAVVPESVRREPVESPLEVGEAGATAQEVRAFEAYSRNWLGRVAGRSHPTLMIAYDPSVWPMVQALLAQIPAELLEDVASTELILATGKGSLPLRKESLELLIQIQPLRSGSVLVTLDLEDGPDVALWLGEESRHLPPRGLLARFQDSLEPGEGLLVPTTLNLKRLVVAPTTAENRWRVADSPPKTFAALIRHLSAGTAPSHPPN